MDEAEIDLDAEVERRLRRPLDRLATGNHRPEDRRIVECRPHFDPFRAEQVPATKIHGFQALSMRLFRTISRKIDTGAAPYNWWGR
jgi:hypothetical protein